MKQLRLALTCMAAMVPAQALLAQGQGPVDGGRGIAVGSFRLVPTLTFGAMFDDNILLRDNRESDVVGTLSTQFTATSNWSSNELVVDASSRHRRYVKLEDQNNDAYRIESRGRLDVTRTFPISGSLSYGREVEERGTPGDDPDFDQFVKYGVLTGTLAAKKQFNYIILSVSAGRTRFRYDDAREQGVPVDQSFRNRNVDTVGGRIGYQIGPTTSLFTSVDYNKVDYARPDQGFNRGSDGLSFLGGVSFEVTRLLHGEASVGYIKQSFDDPRFNDFSGLNYNANITYEPTLLTTLKLGAQRALTDSAMPGVPGVMVSTFNLDVNHELLRTLLLGARAQFERRNYRGIDRSESVWSYGFSARRIVNRFLSVALSYDRQTRSSSGTLIGPSFRNNRVSLSVIVTK